MAVTRERLDGMTCQHADHDPEACTSDALYLRSNCHPGTPTWCRYDDGVMHVECAECGSVIVAVAVAAA